MGTIRRQSIQATLVLIIGVALGFVLKLYLFTKYLTTAEVGLLSVILDAANIFAAFIPLGSQSIFIRYLPHFKAEGESKPKGLLFIGAVLSLLGFLLFALLYLIFQDQITEYYASRAPLFATYVYLLIPLVLARVIYIVGQSYARTLKKNVFPLVIKEILVRALTMILVVGFAASWFDLDGMMILFVIIYYISGAIMTFYLFRMRALNFKPQLSKLKGGLGRDMVIFGLFQILAATSDVLIKNIDSVMLMSFKGLSFAGVYSIAFFIGQMIELPRRAVSQITGPFIAEAMASDDRDMVQSLYHKSSLNQFLVGAVMLICVWTNLDALFELMPRGDEYITGKYVVLFIGLAKLFDMSMGVNSNILQNSPYYRFNFYTLTALGVLAIGLNFILIPKYGLNGAGIATLVALGSINILKSVYVRYRLNYQPFKSSSGIAFIIAILTYFVAAYLPKLDSPFLDILYRSSITVGFFGLLVLRFKVSEDFTQLFKALKKRYLNRK